MTCVWLSLQPTTPPEMAKNWMKKTPVPQPDVEQEGRRLPRIQLKNGLGYMHKRGREAIVRFHRFNREKEADKLYRSKLMLYLTWRDESSDLGATVDFRT